uniref:iron-sulfur cluster co-chaperone protein HscB homolog n=1 Tax=Erigeron canadensis TaxID=72917 RepID=UPI001CB9A4CA|nr:iron-sulfur cluster co-chaperone protein HscB homolog [Erigeron canadensis]
MWRNQQLIIKIKTRTSLLSTKTLNPKFISLQEPITQFQNPPNFSTSSFFIPKQPIWVSQNHPQNHLIIRNPKILGNSFFSSSSESSFSSCWNCKRDRAFLFCESCGSIQPVDHSVDYFTIFGLERKFNIDDRTLEGTYKNWQKKLHPDLVHTKSKEDREYAAEQSARVIDAYTTLRKPLLRAIYIMRLEGIEVDEEQTVSEPELLGEIMEIREAVEEAPDNRALIQIQSQMEEKLGHWSELFANAFESKKYDEALKSIQRMTYYHRVNEEIVKKL